MPISKTAGAPALHAGVFEVGEETGQRRKAEGQVGFAIAQIAPQRDGDLSGSYQRRGPRRDYGSSKPLGRSEGTARMRYRTNAPLIDVTDEANRHDRSAVIVDLERRADQVPVAGRRLIEQALVLERLAEDHLQHALVARVGDGLDLRTPLLDELRVGTRVVRRQRLPGVTL